MPYSVLEVNSTASAEDSRSIVRVVGDGTHFIMPGTGCELSIKDMLEGRIVAFMSPPFASRFFKYCEVKTRGRQYVTRVAESRAYYPERRGQDELDLVGIERMLTRLGMRANVTSSTDIASDVNKEKRKEQGSTRKNSKKGRDCTLE